MRYLVSESVRPFLLGGGFSQAAELVPSLAVYQARIVPIYESAFNFSSSSRVFQLTRWIQLEIHPELVVCVRLNEFLSELQMVRIVFHHFEFLAGIHLEGVVKLPLGLRIEIPARADGENLRNFQKPRPAGTNHFLERSVISRLVELEIDYVVNHGREGKRGSNQLFQLSAPFFSA